MACHGQILKVTHHSIGLLGNGDTFCLALTEACAYGHIELEV